MVMNKFAAIFLLAYCSVFSQINFKPYVAYPAGADPHLCKIADIDNDGINEVVLLTGYYFDTTSDYKVFIFKNDNNRLLLQKTFGYPPIYPGAESFDVKDMNGDSFPELAIGAGDSIFIYEDMAGKSFDLKKRYYSGKSVGSIRISDMNNDDKNDIVVCHWNDSFIKVFINEDSILSPQSYPVQPAGNDQIETGDMNGDSLIDLVFIRGQGAENHFLVFLQNNSGTLAFDTSFDIPNSISAWSPGGMAVGDLNGDKKNDLVATVYGNKPASKIVLWNQDTVLKYLVNYPAANCPEPVKIADFDLDGKNDIVAANGGWNSVSVFRQTSAGVFSNYSNFNIPYASHYKHDGLDVGDINGDKYPDIVIADYNNGLIVLCNNPPITRMLTLSGKKEKNRAMFLNGDVLFSAKNTGPVEIAIFSPLGKAVFQKQVMGEMGKNAIVIPEIAKGVYIVAVSGKDLFLKDKIVVK
jgi:hypothetical protein